MGHGSWGHLLDTGGLENKRNVLRWVYFTSSLYRTLLVRFFFPVHY